jgi:hypothetical protein
MEQIDSPSAGLHEASHPCSDFVAFLNQCTSLRRTGLRTAALSEACDVGLLTPGENGLVAAIATSAAQLRAASALVESRYTWRGYALSGNATQHGVTLIAMQRELTLGTLTLRLDGPAGLAADEVYRATIDAVRERGRRVCELTRLAIDSAAEWRPTFGALLGLAYLVGRVLHEVTDVFVEVNPRHERFYRHMFGFVAAAGKRICTRVKAPAVLLRLEVDRLDARLADFFGANRALLDPGATEALAA